MATSLNNPAGGLMMGGIYYRYPPIHEFHGLKLVTPPVVEPLTVDDLAAQSRIPPSILASDSALRNTLSVYIATAREICETWTLRGLRPQTWRLSLLQWPRVNYIQIPLGPLIDVDWLKYTDTSLVTHTMTDGTDYFVDSESSQAKIVLPFAHVWPPVVMNTAAPIQAQLRIGYPVFNSTVSVNDSSPASGYGNSVSRTAGDLFDPVIENGVASITVGSPPSAYNSVVASVDSPTDLTLLTAVPVGAAAALNYDALPTCFVQAMRMLCGHWYENREAVVIGRGEVPNTMILALNELLGTRQIYRF